jgi:hypothetical protein
MRHLELLVLRHAAPRRLLAVPERGVKKMYAVVGHRHLLHFPADFSSLSKDHP